MPAMRRSSSTKDTRRFYIFLFLVFVLGIAMAVIPWSWLTKQLVSQTMADHVANILVKIGEALIIAPVLAVAVDRAAKLQLLKEFGENISLHIMGRFLPRELRDHLEPYLAAQFVRRNWEITYTLEEWPNQADFVKLTTLSQYEIENCTNDEAEYQFLYEVDDSWYPDVGKSEIVRAGKSNPDTNGQFEDLRGAKLTAQIERLNDGQRFSVPVRIEPASARRGTYVFIAESTECFHKAYKENFTARYPVLNTTLTIYYPATKLDVEVTLSFGGNEAIEETPIEGGRRWYIKKPILPGQSFFTIWKDKPPSPGKPLGSKAVAKADEPKRTKPEEPTAAKAEDSKKSTETAATIVAETPAVQPEK